MSNAISYSRGGLKGALGALENNPTLDDVKTARDLAKGAFETLKAAYDLLSKGIYEVASEDDMAPRTPAPGEPLFNGTEPAPAADLTLPALGFTAPDDHPDAIDAELVHEPTPEELGEYFSGLLDTWEGMGFEAGRGTLKDFKMIRQAWWLAFGEDRAAIAERLREAVDRDLAWDTPEGAKETMDAVAVVQLEPGQVAEILEAAAEIAEEEGQ